MAKNVAKFFTKKVALIALAAVVAVGGIIWAIVANLQPKFRSGITIVPAAAYVSGNGTASVMVDNYLYFVGDSVATSTIKYGDNEYYANGKMPNTGIFRVKIENSKPVVDYKYDNTSTNDAGEKIELQKGDEGYNTKVVGVNDWDKIGKKGNGIEAVVPKIAGHDQSAMWVFGKYLIYVSPHNRYDNRGNLMSDYLDFFRVDLDGNNHTLLYTSDSADLTKDNFTVWANSTDNIYLLVAENSQIKKIDVRTKAVTTLDSDVSNVVLPSATQYRTQNHPNETLDKVYGGVMGYVYYTKAREDGFIGNQLYRCSISGGEPTCIASNGNASEGTTFTPLAVTPLQNGDAQFVYSITVKNTTTTVKGPSLCVITNQTDMDNYSYTEPETSDDGWGLAESDTIKIYANRFCTVNSVLYRYNIEGTRMIFDNTKLLNNDSLSVLAVAENTAYVQSGTTIYMITPNRPTANISIAATVESEDDTTENTITLPVAILYQPYGDTGDPMIYVQNTTDIQLYTSESNWTYSANYLKFKES